MSYYGYGSATGRMSPAESWNQMYLGGDVWTGAREIDPELRSMIREFEGLQWSELPVDIQELWKQMGNYRPSGESIATESQKLECPNCGRNNGMWTLDDGSGDDFVCVWCNRGTTIEKVTELNNLSQAEVFNIVMEDERNPKTYDFWNAGESKTSNCPFNPNGENHEFIKDQDSDVTCKYCGEEVTDYEVKLWGESVSDVDLTCGMCNGTGEIYLDSIVTCHECGGTGTITFDQLPQWKKDQSTESKATEEFKEEEHPRDGDGQFTSKGGSTKDDQGLPPQYGEQNLAKQYSEDPEGVAKTLEDANEDRDLVEDGHLIVTSKYNRETKKDETVIKTIKPYSLSYPEASRNEGYSSELVLNDFKVYSNFKDKNELVAVGDEIEFRDMTSGGGEIITNVLVTGFSYDGDEWEGASAVGYVTYSNDHDEHPIMQEKGHGDHRMSDATRIVSRGGIEMKNAGGESKAKELLPPFIIDDTPEDVGISVEELGKKLADGGTEMVEHEGDIDRYSRQYGFDSEDLYKAFRDAGGEFEFEKELDESYATENDYTKQCLSCGAWGKKSDMTYYDAERVTYEDSTTRNFPSGWVHNYHMADGQWYEDEGVDYGVRSEPIYESKYTIEDDFDESDQNDGEIQKDIESELHGEEKYVRGYENDWKDKLDTWDGRAVSDNFTTVQPYDPVNPKYECNYCNKEFSWDDTFIHDGSHGTLPSPYEDMGNT